MRTYEEAENKSPERICAWSRATIIPEGYGHLLVQVLGDEPELIVFNFANSSMMASTLSPVGSRLPFSQSFNCARVIPSLRANSA
jgi:hypothetical protein